MIRQLVKNSLIVCCIAAAVVIFIGLTLPVFAQVGPGGGGNPCPGGEPCDPEVPITGIEWLLAVGGLFGFRKIYYKLKKA